MKTTRAVLVVLLIMGLAFSSVSVQAVEIVIGDNSVGNSGGLEDNRCDSGNVDENYGAHASGFAGELNGPRYFREIQRWDLSDIPSGATCDSAVMSLYDTDWANRDADCTITIYKIAAANGDWVVGTENDNPQVDSSCWEDKAYNEVAEWAGSPGLNTAGTDYVNTSLGSAIFTDGVSGYRTITLNADGKTALEAMFGAGTNDGLLLVGAGAGKNCTEWDSAQGTDTQRPILTINYTAAGGLSIPIVMHHRRHG